MATLNLNLRGLMISPEKKQDTIHYYLCLIDIPADSLNGDFSINNPQPGDTTLSYSYSGVLSEIQPGGQVQTIALPLFTNQQIAQPNSTNDNLTVVVTDSAKNSVSGDPNKLRPPVIQLIDTTQSLICANVVVQSESSSTTNYFIITLVNTDSSNLPHGVPGGFSNLWYTSPIQNDPTSLYGWLTPKAGNKPVCALAVYSASDTSLVASKAVANAPEGGWVIDSNKFTNIDYSSPIML